MNWDDYPNFTREEFECKHTGKCEMQASFMQKLQGFRTAWGKPMTITSGYRAPEHPIEAAKNKPGEHSYGMCCDISVEAEDVYKFVELAIRYKFLRIGISQKAGAPRFVHLGDSHEFPHPRIWTY